MIKSDKTNGIGGSYSWVIKYRRGTVKRIGTEVNTSITQGIQFYDFTKSDVKWLFTLNENGNTQVRCHILGKELLFGFKTEKTTHYSDYENLKET